MFAAPTSSREGEEAEQGKETPIWCVWAMGPGAGLPTPAESSGHIWEGDSRTKGQALVLHP